MRVSQKIALDNKDVALCHRRIGSSSSWKQSSVRYSLDNIYIFNGVEATKLRSAITIKSIRDVELLTKAEMEGDNFPHPYVFLVSWGEEKDKYKLLLFQFFRFLSILLSLRFLHN
jgi:hypothetical protein